MSTIEERFWAKVNKTSDCWIWTGAKCGGARGGYGSFKIGRSTKKAHRVSYEWANGAIPDGLVIDHTCHRRDCVNPTHLQAVTHKENLENLSGAYSSNKSSVRGVTWDQKSGKWAARVRHGGILHHGGLHGSIAKAEEAVLAIRLRLFTNNSLDRRPTP